ncbi:MAG: P-loop NTPase [Thermoguttaceae bacterium]|jgi:MinD-like ATPase involved in chromosome partitioning or flagellar assembly
MLDQAHDLRRLATRRSGAESLRCDGRPAMVVVVGGKGGVGTTTVALSLATAAKAGRRTLLVDADSRGGDLALVCGIEERYTLADVLAGRRTWNEAVCPGPAGVAVVVGQRGWHDGRNPAAAAGHLLEQFDRQDIAAKLVVIDAGNRLDGAAAQLCREANAVVMVTSGEAAAVVGAFAGIKALAAASNGSRRPALYLLVNMAPSARIAETVYYRLARTCRRMLGIELQSAGRLGIARRANKNSKNSRSSAIGLNLQVDWADTVRGVLVVEGLAN